MALSLADQLLALLALKDELQEGAAEAAGATGGVQNVMTEG